MSWREKLLVTRAEAAEILGCSTKRIDRLIRANKLRIKKEGRQVSILTASLAEYVDEVSEPDAALSEPLSAEARASLARALHRASSGRS